MQQQQSWVSSFDLIISYYNSAHTSFNLREADSQEQLAPTSLHLSHTSHLLCYGGASQEVCFAILLPGVF
jgi:hypothetical protein